MAKNSEPRGRALMLGLLHCALAVLVANCRGEREVEVPDAPDAALRMPAWDGRLPEPTVVGSGDGVGFSARTHGKIVVIDFWATWCGPCRASIPTVRRLAAAYADDDVVVIGVHVGDDEGQAAGFGAAAGIEYPLYVDVDRRLATELAVTNMPAVLVFDRDGRLVHRSVEVDRALLQTLRDLKSGDGPGSGAQ